MAEVDFVGLNASMDNGTSVINAKSPFLDQGKRVFD
jgi:hypothetical protein